MSLEINIQKLLDTDEDDNIRLAKQLLLGEFPELKNEFIPHSPNWKGLPINVVNRITGYNLKFINVDLGFHKVNWPELF